MLSIVLILAFIYLPHKPIMLQAASFLGAFAELRKVTISFVTSVRPSVHISLEQLGSHCTDFHEISYLRIFKNSVKKIQVSITYDKNNGYFTRRPTYVRV